MRRNPMGQFRVKIRQRMIEDFRKANGSIDYLKFIKHLEQKRDAFTYLLSVVRKLHKEGFLE